MTIEQSIEVIESLALVAEAFAWPMLIVFLVLYFGKPLKKFLGDIGEFTFKAGTSGLEATARRQQIKAAASLGAASASKTAESLPSDEDISQEIANVVDQTTKPQGIRRLAGTRVLWVDDIPSNNFYERRSLEAFDIRFTLSTSTDDAIEKLQVNKYDVIISDMGRPSDNRAGYTLLEEKQKLEDTTPYIIYSSSNRPEHKAEARRRGAVGNTNNPQELFQIVLDAIQAD